MTQSVAQLPYGESAAAIQVEYAAQIHRKIVKFLTNQAAIMGDVGAIDAFYREVLGRILKWARLHTDSQFGTVLLAQDVEGPDSTVTELVLYARRGKFVQGSPERWLSTRGITGKAYTTGQPCYLQRVDNPQYLKTFSGVEDEVAVPLKRGDRTIGVLNVESNQPNHYTENHVGWLEFLARLTVLALSALEIATKTHREATLKKLAVKIQDSILAMHHQTMVELMATRDSLRQDLMDTTRGLTGASDGAMFAAMSAYLPSNKLDQEYGRLITVTASPPLPSGSDPYAFSLSSGLASKVFQTGKRLVFNTSEQRPPGYDEIFSWHGANSDPKSGIIIPILGGIRTIGLFTLEFSDQYALTTEVISIVEEAARLASQFLVASALRQDELQAKLLREFDLTMLALDTPHTEGSPPRVVQFATDVLRTAENLTGLSNGVGQLLFARRYPGDDVGTIRKERTFTLHFGQDALAADSWEEHDTETDLLANTFERDHPPIVDRDMLNVFHTKRSILLFDTRKPVASRLPNVASEEARSWLCLPLLRLQGIEEREELFGFLVVATSEPYSLNDSDAKALNLLCRAAVLGLENVRLLDARTDLMLELTHDFGKALRPLIRIVEALSETLSELSSEQQTLAQVQRIGDLAHLSRDLMDWYFDLSNESPPMFREDNKPVQVGTIVESMHLSVATLAEILTGRVVHWNIPTPQPYVEGGTVRERLLKAALFKYIENALKYGSQSDVFVDVGEEMTTDGRRVVFAVRNKGRQLPLNEQTVIFERGFRGSNVGSIVDGAGIGLYQVKRIAMALGGDVEYRPEHVEENVFILRLPAYEATTE